MRTEMGNARLLLTTSLHFGSSRVAIPLFSNFFSRLNGTLTPRFTARVSGHLYEACRQKNNASNWFLSHQRVGPRMNADVVALRHQPVTRRYVSIVCTFFYGKVTRLCSRVINGIVQCPTVIVAHRANRTPVLPIGHRHASAIMNVRGSVLNEILQGNSFRCHST